MDQSNLIWRNLAGRGELRDKLMRITFSLLINSGYEAIESVTRYACSFCSEYSKMFRFRDILGGMCLGLALDVIASKQCQNFSAASSLSTQS